MATEVYNKETIQLQDGREVTLKPLTIKHLRKFMAAWRSVGEELTFSDDMSEDDKIEASREHEYDVFVTVAGIALEKEIFDDVTKDVVAGDDETKAQVEERKREVYKDYLEDTLDMETIFKVIEICAGMKLNDPNLLAVAAANLAEGGTN